MSIPWPALGRDLLLVTAYNTAIGLFLTALSRYTLGMNLLYSYCIGTGIYIAIRLPGVLRSRWCVEWRAGLVGIPVGFTAGFALATALAGWSLAEVLDHHRDGLLMSAATALIFGVLGTWHFRNQDQILTARREAEVERARRIEQENLAARTQLALLQAQIEPHFLFNTLSNVVGLIDTEPAAARRMLIDLTALLRTSLARTRRSDFALGEELDLLRAYLGIMSVRMGARLRWQIDADPAALSARLPPLMVQPLVENAIRHGIEPAADGGELTVRCQRNGGDLVIDVDNSGLPFARGAGAGLGLANVRERLASCYGSRAGLELHARPGGGLAARIRLPFDDHEPAPADR